MASTNRCQYCNSTISSEDRKCPYCGAENPNYVADTPRTVFLPQTIEELKEYCAERGMPLLRMRFFIGEDFKEPRAFGIYRDGDQFIVYKNKSDGSRAIRYQGPNEAFAVNELFMKLLEECHNRGIYPDGKMEKSGARVKTIDRNKQSMIASLLVIVFCVLITALVAHGSIRQHQHDGYYQGEDTDLYYRYGETWYYNPSGSSWMEAWTVPFTGDPEEYFEEYYLGDSFDSDWEGTDFRESAVWEEIHESSSSSSSDYDSWDSSDTDWDSDW